MMISGWCMVAIIALMIGGICSLQNGNENYFRMALIITLVVMVVDSFSRD